MTSSRKSLHIFAEDYLLDVPEDLEDLKHVNKLFLPFNLRQEFCFKYASLPE